MEFKLLIYCGNAEWPERIRATIPDCEVLVAENEEEARAAIVEADAAFGNITPDILAEARKLKWIQAPAAGPRAGYYHQALVKSEVVVTNFRGIFSDHIGAHILSYVLAFARGLPYYWRHQQKGEWARSTQIVYLPESTAVIVGVGGIGSEAARLCHAFGIDVIGIDPRRENAPEGCGRLWGPDRLEEALPLGDFVIVTCPETPDTQGLMDRETFALMKPAAYFINTGRAAVVVTEDLVEALRAGKIAGAALDVVHPEPLPPGHPLWTFDNVLLTPHVADTGPYTSDRRTDLFMDNCRRFSKGLPLRNVVDKAKWF